MPTLKNLQLSTKVLGISAISLPGGLPRTPCNVTRWPWHLRTMLYPIRFLLYHVRPPPFSLHCVPSSLCPQLIEEKNFKGAFGEKIPTGFNRHELSSHTKALKDKVERRLLDRLYEDVFLMVDGGTLNRKRLLNACIGNEGVSYFYRSIRVESLRADQVATSLQEIIDQLSREKVYVFCIVADNAATFQKSWPTV